MYNLKTATYVLLATSMMPTLFAAAANSYDYHFPSLFPKTGEIDGTFSELFSSSKFSFEKEKFIHKEHSVHERRHDIKKSIRANPEIEHEVIFAVKQNLEEITALVNDVSNPFSVNFGKHLKKTEVTAFTSNPASRDHILAYLALHDGIKVDKSSASSEYIRASAPVHKWETMFATEFFEFELEDEEEVKNKKQKLIRATSYSLPENLHSHVSAVFNTVQFPVPNKKSVKSDTILSLKTIKKSSNAGIFLGYTTPELINQVYDIRNNTVNSLGSQAVYETSEEAYSPSDLTQFQEFFNLTVVPVAHNIGDYELDNACSLYDCYEGNLDVQYIMAVSELTPTTYYYWSGSDFLVDWVTEVAEMDDPPLVISISWGGPESYFGESYIEAFNTEAVKLAAMGVTLVAASGDDGAPSYIARRGPKYCAYYPDFPSVSYYVTSLGATQGPEDNGPEVACSGDTGGLITSGGGFSDIFPVPDWQADFTASYFTNAASDGTTPYQGYNANGYGTPTISALGHNYIIVTGGNYSVVSGTSASSPVFAGMVSLVNAKRLAAGKSSLGWLNPSLFALHESFVNDITSGDNNCIVYGRTCCAQGFTATTGWDPVTGLGSVNFNKFEEAFFALGDYPNTPTEAPALTPSINPAHPPTHLPSHTPTTMPTTSAGWVYGTYHSGQDCTGDNTVVQGFKMGKCFRGYDANGGMNIYFKYSCDSELAYVLIYSDSSCANLLHTSYAGLGCSYHDQYYYYGETEYSFSYECSASTALPLDNTNTYAVESAFDSQLVCDSSDLSGFSAYMNNYCFTRTSEGFSYNFTYPNVSYWYTNTHCSGKKGKSFILSTTCDANGADDFYYYYNYGRIEQAKQWSKVGATASKTPTLSPTAIPTAPTIKPSPAPTTRTPTTSVPTTRVPTQTRVPTRSPTTRVPTTSAPSTRSPTNAENYIMFINQRLNGITAAEFNSDDANSDAFRATVEDCMEGIHSSDVSIILLTDIPVSSAVVVVKTLNLRRLAASDSVNIDYSVSYNIAALGFSGNPDGAFEFLFNSLNSSVTSGAFDAYLAANSVTYGAPDMASVTSGSVGTSGYTSPDSDDKSGGSSNGLSAEDKKVAMGVGIGVGGFLLFIIIGFVYVSYRSANSQSVPPPAPGADNRPFEPVSTDQVEMAETDKAVTVQE